MASKRAKAAKVAANPRAAKAREIPEPREKAVKATFKEGEAEAEATTAGPAAADSKSRAAAVVAVQARATSSPRLRT
jgi:hypothetical protein